MQDVPSVKSSVPSLRVHSAELFQVYAYELLDQSVFYRLNHAIKPNKSKQNRPLLTYS
jgi:hypothetical protein